MLIAAVSGANTEVRICLSTGMLIKSVVDVNFTSNFWEAPFWSVLITSIVYVPNGKLAVDGGHVNNR